MIKMILLLALISSFSLCAQNDLNLVPMPASVEMPATPGTFNLAKNTPLVLQGSGLEKSAAFLNKTLQQLYGFKLVISRNANAKNAVLLNYERLDNDLPGAYRMEVNKKGISIAGDNETGVFYAIQTLLQLLPKEIESRTAVANIKWEVPAVEITDYPRFGWRGLMFDVARHFFTKEDVKRYIDDMVRYKFNLLHLGLTNDEG